MVRFPTPAGTQRGYGQIVYVGGFDPEEHEVTSYKAMINENWERYQKEPVRAALDKIKDESPKGRVIMAPMPEAFGGARELNATQIELIVDWLKDVYCPTLILGPSRDDPSYASWANSNVPSRRKAIALVEEVSLKREEVDQLKAICRKLRQVPR